MNVVARLNHWLETHWVSPSYGGMVLFGIALCFLGAAINTMAGWLYVVSGIIFALLILAAILASRSLRQLKIHRQSILPVSAGDALAIELEIANPTPKPRALLQFRDLLPFVLGKPMQHPIEAIPPKGVYRWIYDYPTEKRGVYRWHDVEARSGTPLGLFWCRKSWTIPAKAVVYPTVLPLTHCPLVDNMGQEENVDFYSDRHYNTATEGITKSLRPYRIGDPIRLIHWRSSARLGEFQVRELEVVTGGQEVIICLDSATQWDSEAFEQAVIAAASLYFYATKLQFNVKLWTANTGLLSGNIAVLEALAATYIGEDAVAEIPTDSPLVLLTSNTASFNHLSSGSRWLLFSQEEVSVMNFDSPGLIINSHEPLAMQLQKPLRS